MSVISIELDDRKGRALKDIAAAEGRTVDDLVGDLVDAYVRSKQASPDERTERAETTAAMKLSEPAFAEWDNSEDAVYDRM
jgi:hypothetical protein